MIEDYNQIETGNHVRNSGIIAIIRGDFPLARYSVIAQALLVGGVTVVEITLNSTGALEGITELRQKFAGQMLVGAGTVCTAEDVAQALSAGAQFLVSPNFDPASVAASQAAGILHLPGIFTASEAQAAYAAGCKMVKLFPADAIGPSYLKALRAPLNHIDFAPTGGINVDTIAGYVKAGAVAFGVGSSLVTNATQEPGDLIARAKALVAALTKARSE